MPYNRFGAGFGGGGSLSPTPTLANMKPFEYDPNQDMDDPELNVLRNYATEESAGRRRNNLNEIARAGLLGSSASFDVMQGGDIAGSRDLENITQSVLARRRGEARDDYRAEQEFRREMQLARLRSQLQGENQGTDLGGLGQLLPLLLPMLTGGASYGGSVIGGGLGGGL